MLHLATCLLSHPAMVEFGAEQRSPSSFCFALASTCILICLYYCSREGLGINKYWGMLMDFVCLEPFLNYPWTWKACTVLCNKVCGQAFPPSCLGPFGIKRKN